MSFSLQHAPIRCFFREIHDKFCSFKPGERDVKFRLLGTVVGITEMDGDAEALSSTVPRSLVKLDDGTALASVIVTAKMISKLDLQTGSLVECIAAMRTQKRPASSQPSSDATSPLYSLLAEQVAIMDDVNAETLRWMELCHDKGSSPQGEDPPHWQGFPAVKSTAMDLYRIIEYQCEFAREDSPSQKPTQKGVSADHLKMCLGLTEDEVVGLLDELQVGSWC